MRKNKSMPLIGVIWWEYWTSKKYKIPTQHINQPRETIFGNELNELDDYSDAAWGEDEQ